MLLVTVLMPFMWKSFGIDMISTPCVSLIELINQASNPRGNLLDEQNTLIKKFTFGVKPHLTNLGIARTLTRMLKRKYRSKTQNARHSSSERRALA